MNELVISIGLIVLLATKQICEGSDSEFALRLARFAIPSIIPLMILVVIIIAQEMNELL